MRAVVQRVSSASVTVGGEVVGAIDGPGLLVYLGVTHDDGPDDVAWTARKTWDLRILRDEQSASDVGGCCRSQSCAHLKCLEGGDGDAVAVDRVEGAQASPSTVRPRGQGRVRS